MDGFWLGVIWALVPTIVVVGIFFFILRGVVHMDRNERRAYAEIEAQERAKRGMTQPEPSAAAPSSR